MFTYYYECECGYKFDRKSDVRLGKRKCPECGKRAPLVRMDSGKPMNTVNIIFDLKPHFDRGMGKWVKSRQHKRALMEENGLQEADPSLAEKAEEILEENEYQKHS